MSFKDILSPADLERRLSNWVNRTHVPRYPFFDFPSSLAVHSTGYSPSSSILASSVSLTTSSQDLNHWLEFVEDAAKECEIEENQYPDTAVWFMRGELREVMRERRGVYLREAEHMAGNKSIKKRKDWDDFKKDLKRVVDEATRIFLLASSQVRQTSVSIVARNTTQARIPETTFAFLRRTHPYIASSLSLGLVIGGTVVLLPAISLGIEAWNRMRDGAKRAGSQIGCPA